MVTILKILSGALAGIVGVVGFGWWVAPAQVGAGLGMTLLEGAGRSTQIGDLSAFFLVMSGCIFRAIVSNSRVWLFPSILLVTVALLGRIVAWQFHDAALPLDMVAFETVAVIVLLLTFRALPKDAASAR